MSMPVIWIRTGLQTVDSLSAQQRDGNHSLASRDIFNEGGAGDPKYLAD
jgi:hypothetical protein